MQKYGFDIIGTHLDILFDTDVDTREISRALGERLALFEARFSRFLEWNWLYELNEKRSAILDTDAKTMLTYMLEVARKTDGYFDPTVGKRLTELGYGKTLRESNFSVISTWGDILPWGNKQDFSYIRNDGKWDYRDIEIVWDEVILHWDILLEFWGVGKGYLIDIIYTMIEAALPDTKRYLINFGWDLYGKWGWKVGLESPFASDEVIGTITLEDHFLACSAGTKRKWWTHHHLIDPKTWESAREVIASYIEWDSGMTTDAYATALCVMPWDLAVETLMSTREISWVIVRHDWVLYQKEGSRSEVFV